MEERLLGLDVASNILHLIRLELVSYLARIGEISKEIVYMGAHSQLQLDMSKLGFWSLNEAEGTLEYVE